MPVTWVTLTLDSTPGYMIVIRRLGSGYSAQMASPSLSALLTSNWNSGGLCLSGFGRQPQVLNDVADEAAAHMAPGKYSAAIMLLLLGREIGMRHDRHGSDLVPVFVVCSPRRRWRFHESGVRHPAECEVAEVSTFGTPRAHLPPAWHPDEGVREVPASARRRKGETAAAKAKRRGATLSLVAPSRGAIAKTFWGKACCENLEPLSACAMTFNASLILRLSHSVSDRA